MKRLTKVAGLLFTGAVLSAASEEPRQTLDRKEMPVVHARAEPQETPVGNLPHARGQTFRTLDEYLAFLRKQGFIDKPWYREIRPGIYELQTSRAPAPERRIFTREELEKKFGFSR